jgi:hypothetical protein
MCLIKHLKKSLKRNDILMTKLDEIVIVSSDKPSDVFLKFDPKTYEDISKSDKTIRRIRDECIIYSNKHIVNKNLYNMLYKLWAWPNILVTIVMICLASMVDHPHVKYILITGFLISGFISCVSLFYNFAKLSQQHLDFGTRYAELALEIHHKIVENIIFPDSFYLNIFNTFDKLNEHAPTNSL